MAIRVVRQNQYEIRMLKVGTASPGYLRALDAQFVGRRYSEDADARPGAAVVILSESEPQTKH
jgi:hypothetical protein